MKRKRSPKTIKRRAKTSHLFPIVGIGASAGGLEALALFLGGMPADSGMAYIVVQHLDPKHKGMMPELLQRVTAMKVMQVKDGVKVKKNCVYVIPPNADLSILRGKLHLLTPAEPRGLRLPIDSFLNSLADDQRERSVGVILSGMGSDGTQGIRAIKERAGVVLVQEPASAKFDAMPRSAVNSGMADFVAPAEELPAKLIAFQQHRPLVARSDVPVETKTQNALEKIVILLRAHTGQDFSLYRRTTLYRRVERRMSIHQIVSIVNYVRYLQENPQELDILFKELLIGVTSFFRDPVAWEKLAKSAIPALLTKRPEGGVIRAWVAGCSTGEEAYSLAIVLSEVIERLKVRTKLSLQVYATDLDRDAIDRARQGFFGENIAAVVSPARIARFFTKEETGYRVKKEIRTAVVFAVQNLIMDPPFTKLDMISCRNLLIYLTPELQKKLLPLFHYSLNPGGLLFLGSAESVGGFGRLFATLAAKERIFRRSDSSTRSESLDFPAVFVPVPTVGAYGTGRPARVPSPSLQSVADQYLHSLFAPPAVLVNEAGDILYVSGKTGRYLEPAAGKANWNILAMAHEQLRFTLTRSLQVVQKRKGALNVRGIQLGFGASTRSVDVLVQALEEPKALQGMVLVVFSESAAPSAAGGVAKHLARHHSHTEVEQELQRAREEVQANREEMQTSQEELTSMNEELQSTNEELQSTNEELTTSKEEMQSLNEELQTVNAELQAKLDELSSANNDMKNLLNSTDIATVFLDNDLQVRRFTLQAKTIIKLIPGDIGRPITDLASHLNYPDLEADSREVLRTLVFKEKEVAATDGRWFMMRLMPYRTTDNRIDGVVMTFADVTAAKKVEAKLREKQGALEIEAVGQAAKLAKAEAQFKSGVAGNALEPAVESAPARAVERRKKEK
ncbi:MAG TPA: chemotaxis protein CheB [Opitutaceae bacterium]|nr:chemotaxis protein CheB [Opitutaceae bacterium]